MDRRTQTYGWLLLLVFVLGGLVAPVLHFNQHASDKREAQPVAADAAVVHTTTALDYTDCALCDATLLAMSAMSSVMGAAVLVEITSQHAPPHFVLDLIGNTSDRGPPAALRG